MAIWDETKMKVAITGHKNGLGKELAAWFVGSKDEVVGFDKEDGFDVNRLKMKDLEGCDMFINNAWDRFVQVKLFEMVYNVWRHDETKTIVNISSMAANKDIITNYSASKKMLDEMSDRSVFYGKCKTHNIKLGYMNTSFATHLKKQEDALDVSEASRMIYEVITHKYYIPTIGIMAKKN
jgi:NAD(P)-dependent dehydrogenase (short-subunit alcohol dehydrogenase family)